MPIVTFGEPRTIDIHGVPFVVGGFIDTFEHGHHVVIEPAEQGGADSGNHVLNMRGRMIDGVLRTFQEIIEEKFGVSQEKPNLIDSYGVDVSSDGARVVLEETPHAKATRAKVSFVENGVSAPLDEERMKEVMQSLEEAQRRITKHASPAAPVRHASAENGRLR